MGNRQLNVVLDLLKSLSLNNAKEEFFTLLQISLSREARQLR